MSKLVTSKLPNDDHRYIHQFAFKTFRRPTTSNLGEKIKFSMHIKEVSESCANANRINHLCITLQLVCTFPDSDSIKE